MTRPRSGCHSWDFFVVQVRDWIQPFFSSEKAAKLAYDPVQTEASQLDNCQRAPISIVFVSCSQLGVELALKIFKK